MRVMIDLRNQFREEEFPGADMIRDRLAEAGIQLKDSREGIGVDLEDERPKKRSADRPDPTL